MTPYASENTLAWPLWYMELASAWCTLTLSGVLGTESCHCLWPSSLLWLLGGVKWWPRQTGSCPHGRPGQSSWLLALVWTNACCREHSHSEPWWVSDASCSLCLSRFKRTAHSVTLKNRRLLKAFSSLAFLLSKRAPFSFSSIAFPLWCGLALPNLLFLLFFF